MIDLFDRWVAFAPLLVAGTSVLLTGGCGWLLCTRSPVHRQRLGELTLLAVFVWLLLALIPLPRLLPHSLARRTAPPTAEMKLEQAQPAVAESSLATAESPDLVKDDTEHAAIIREDDISSLLPTSEVPSTEPIAPPRTVAELARLQTGTRNAMAELLSQLPFISGTVFLAGASGCLLWLMLGHVLLARLRNRSRLPEPWLADIFEQLSAKAHVSVRARLFVCSRDSRPLSWGVLRPTILLPESLCRPDNQDQLRVVLLHELGHVAQRDALGNLLLCLALPLLYWHPCYWWLRGQMQLAAELVADDWAARQAGKEAYVSELVSLAKTTRHAGLPLLAATGIFSTPSQFYRRMNMLLARDHSLATRPSLTWRLGTLGLFAAAVVLSSLAIGVRSAPGQGPGQAKVEEKPKPVELPAVPDKATPVESKATPAPEPSEKATVPKITEAPAEPDAEKERLIERIKLLQDRLEELEGRLRLSVRFAPPKEADKTVHVIRVDEKGVTWDEVWTIDETGRPAKIIRKSASETRNNGPHPKPSVPALPNSAKSRPEKTEAPLSDEVKVYPLVGPAKIVTKPGTPHTLETPATPSTPANSAALPTAGAYPTATVRAPVDVPATGGSSKQLDLVNLATSYADAVGAVDTAKAAHARLEPLVKSNTISENELSTTRISLANAQRKEQLLRRIAEAALIGAEREFEYASALHKKGYVSQSAPAEAQSRIEILKQILGSAK